MRQEELKIKPILMTRNGFRKSVLERDNNQCIVCGSSADITVHHIMERRLWSDCGYYMENGATLCKEDHLLAEQTILSCEKIREAAGIDNIILPPHLYKEYRYEKWANIILPDGRRLRGELFFDSSVQKILESADLLKTFCKYVKYPRTYHLSFSGKVTKDDKILSNHSHFEGKRVIVMEKYDGENTTIYHDYIHARSIDSESHPSQSWVRNLQGKVGYNIPEGFRVCGENLYAKHTISYDALKSFFLVFSIWNERNECIDWEATLEWAQLLDLEVIPVLYDGIWDEEKIKKFCDDDTREGFVVRIADSFSYGQFRTSVAKFVHPKFRNKLEEEDTYSWRYRQIMPNKLDR